MPTADHTDDYDTDSCAALDFEKVADGELLRQFHAGPWAEECNNAGVTMRIAALMLAKTKAEMTEAAHELGADHMVELLKRLAAQEERFSALAALLKSLEARLCVAASAA